MIRLAREWSDAPTSSAFTYDSPDVFQHTEETEETEETDGTEETDETDETQVDRMAIVDLENAVNECALAAIHTSDRTLFELARKIRAIENEYSFRLSPQGLR